MGVGLQPLEFTECLADSPQFRENLQRHEKELERTSQQIKRLIKEVKDVVQAAKRLGTAQLALAASMEQFEFACIGASMTEDERVISRSLHHFAHLIRTIEDERERMLGRAHEQIIQPLERFRKEHIGAVKEGKKKFDKKTAKFCQSQERTLSLSTKKPENVFQEADAAMDMAERDFCQASLEYVFQLQAVQERKKFELVETLLGFVFGWWTFHHTAHDVHADAEPRVRDLQLRIQRTRSNFEEMSKQTESLMKKMMEVRQMHKEEEAGEEAAGGVSRAGYLFLMEKKAFGTTTWSKHYCTYEKSSRQLAMTPYNQINVKTAGGSEVLCVCGARACAEPAERRFCWECVPAERERAPLTLQALGERDRAGWLRALDGPPGAARRARRRRLRLRAPPHRRHRGARPGGAGPVPRGGRGLQGGAPGGVRRARPPPARLAARPARVGDQDAHVGAQELPARAARPAAHARAARAVHRRGQVRAARGARGGRGGAGAGAAAAQPGHAAPRHRAPAQCGGAQRQEPDVVVQPGGVLRAHAAARRARDRGVHPRPQVLQRAGGDAARALRRRVRARRRAAARAAAAQRRAQDVSHVGGGGRARPVGGGAPGRERGRLRAHAGRGAGRGRDHGRTLLAAPPPAAAALRAAARAAQRRRSLQQQLGRVCLEPQRVAAARGGRGGRGGGGPGRRGGAVLARAHAVRVPGRERGRAVVRAQPDHHERGAQRRAGLAARHAQRQDGPRARELRGAAALRPRRAHTPNIIS